MHFTKKVRNSVLVTAASLGIYFSPVGVGEVGAETTQAADFSSSELRETSSKYLGTKYAYGGTTTAGFDCSGFVWKVYNDFGIELPRTARDMYALGEPVKAGEIRPGDLLFYNTSGSGISHVAIYYGNGLIIHSQTGKGVSFSNFFDQYYWYDRFVGAKRIADVELVSQNKNG